MSDSRYQENYIRVRIKSSGQVLDMLPAPAIAMINGGTAERVEPEKKDVLTAALDVVKETASRAAALPRRVVNRSVQA